jgi:hypothetical protein
MKEICRIIFHYTRIKYFHHTKEMCRIVLPRLISLPASSQNYSHLYPQVFGSTLHDMEASQKLAEVARGVATKIQQAVGAPEAPRALAITGMGAGTNPNWLGVVRMRGLPFSASADDIRAFFKDLTIKPDGIVLCEGRDGRPNGEAFIEFTKEAYADDAVQFHRQVRSEQAEILSRRLTRIRWTGPPCVTAHLVLDRQFPTILDIAVMATDGRWRCWAGVGHSVRGDFQVEHPGPHPILPEPRLGRPRPGHYARSSPPQCPSIGTILATRSHLPFSAALSPRIESRAPMPRPSVCLRTAFLCS